MMANSKIKGITIEIGGNTTKLQDALKDVDKTVYSLNGDLKALNQALKLDPTNTQLLVQKQEVLARNIQATKERLDTLKEAQRQMGDYNKLTDEQKQSYNQLSLEIAKGEKALKEMNKELNASSKVDLSKLKDGLKKVGDVALDVSKKMLKITSAVAGALTAVVGTGVKSYAELEKAQKGSERLFGTAFSTVKKNATEAYKTMGISAKDYYDQVNTYAVGLKESLGGDAEKSAQLANDILVAQADIVAATGANQDAVQNAFAAVMRGNYALIDNLRLGIKGSKQGMQEVINKVNEWNKAQGNATHYQMDNYADMQQALVDYVEMQGIAGTASDQLSTTVSGSVSQMKSAFDNFLNGSGSPQAVADSALNTLRNVSSAISKLAPDILKGISSLIKEVLPKAIKMILDLAPDILSSISEMLDGILQFLSEDTDELQNTINKLIEALITFITENLPKLVEIALQIVIALATGIANNVDKLVPSVIECILKIVEVLTDPENILKLVGAGIQLVVGLGTGLIEGIPKMLEKIPEIIGSLVSGLTSEENIKKIKTSGANIILGLAKGMTLLNPMNAVKNAATSIGGKIISWIKQKLGIASPSKVMMEYGKFIDLGLAEGIENNAYEVEKAMGELATSVESSVNPTINPTANSNPLYVTIDKFYNNRETDIQQLAEELEFYRKNSALAKGGA